MKYLFAFLFFVACQTPSDGIDSVVKSYYSTYRTHSDFESYMDFYADTAILDDVMLRFHLNGKDSIALFLNWNNSDLQILDSVAMEFDEPVVDGLKSTTTGHFTAFSWQGEKVDGMAFITELHFNTDHKIIYHRDWIDYPRAWLQ